MADDDNNNANEQSIPSHPYFVQAEFPFVFIPSAGFTFTNNQTNIVADDDDENHANRDENDETIDAIVRNNDFRISQPKYSQLLKDLDFSQTRMVDVTNLLADELVTSDENEHIEKANNNDDKYQSLPASSTDDDDDDQEKSHEILSDAANEIQSDLNNLADVLFQASQMPFDDHGNLQKTKSIDEDDDNTSKQATQNYDFNDNEQQQEISSTTKINDKNLRFSSDIDNLSSIPRLNPSNTDEQPLTWDNLLNGTSGQQPEPTHITPNKQQETVSNRASSSLSDEYPFSQTKTRSHQQQQMFDGNDDFQEKRFSTSTPSEILLQRLSNENLHANKPKSQMSTNETNNSWLNTLDKLEHEHKQRLERQQKQYEEYMQILETKMKQRFDEYLNSTNNINKSNTDSVDYGQHRTHQYRPLAKTIDQQQTTSHAKLSRSQSREDISTLRTELTAKHAKHISDLKSYYEDEIQQLNQQLHRTRMGSQTSTTTRQSIETIERINKENIRLHDELKELRRTLKLAEDENRILKRQIDDLREQINRKDVELKNFHRQLTDIEQEFKTMKTTNERQEDKFRQTDRQMIHYREENERLTNELNLTRQRFARLEERYRNLENQNSTHRSQILNANNNERSNHDVKLNSTMAMNVPTSREYGRFTLTTSKYSATSSTVTTPRDINLDSPRYASNGADNLFQQNTSPRTATKIAEYIHERPAFPQSYVPPSRPVHSSSRLDQIPGRDFIENHIKQSEQLEDKFDDLLKTKRDLESRINRIPTRALTSTDRQLLEVLEREMERVDHQISSVKLELRKMNILRTTH